MDSEFKLGDVVELKSGGPQMTVAKIGPMGLGGSKVVAWCDWFDGSKKNHDHFAPESLKLSSDSRVR